MLGRAIYIVGFLCLLASCEQPKEEVLDMSDIMPNTKNDEKPKNDSLSEIKNVKELEFFNQSSFEFDEVKVVQERLFPDRFGPDTIQTYDLVKGNDTMRYHKWNYANESKVMNAFYNWIDCFGSNCKSIQVGDEKNLQAKSLLFLVSDTTLIFIEGSKINYDDWYEFHETIGYENNWKYCVEQGPRGKAKWFIIEDEKKIKYIKK